MNADQEVYIACGCGCCGGYPVEEQAEKCVKNEAELQKIIREDQKIRKNNNICALAGCSAGVKYKICKGWW
jgi:hypothetical protein